MDINYLIYWADSWGEVKIRGEMVQKSKGTKSPLKHSQVGLIGPGGLKGKISDFMVKRQNIFILCTWH